MFVDAFGGFVAGVTGTIIGYPLDTIKTRMQQVNSTKGLFGTATNIMRIEGVSGFYKGVATPLLSLTILNTLNFASFNYFKASLSSASSSWSSLPPSLLYFVSGAMVGPLASTISTPEHMLKTQLQLDNSRSSPLYTRGAFRAAQSLIRSHSLSVLYVGHTANTLREGVFLGVYFSSYELVKADAAVQDALGSKLAVPVAGGLAGMAGWVVSYPLDCIKANIQGAFCSESAATGSGRKAPTSILAVGLDILKKRGITGLYSGMTPSLIRAFLVSGSRFTAFEIAVSMYRTNDQPPSVDEQSRTRTTMTFYHQRKKQ